MTKYYVVNANGDWWTMERDSSIYAITEENLKAAIIADGNDPEEVENLTWNFDLDGAILQHGTAIQPLTAYEEGMKDALNYLSDLFEGVKETDLWAQYMTSEGAK